MHTSAIHASAPTLTDPHGRQIRKLRISLTDACDYRCFYCMPQNPVFAKENTLLRPGEYASLCGELAALGITQIRVTGGEPGMRTDFEEIMQGLGKISGVSLALTSNGERLEKHLPLLWDTGCRSLNISMDSLDPGKFHRITGGGNLGAVQKTIFAARKMGFHLKVNAVVFRNINSDELSDFHDWSAREGIEVRFLEFMKIGPAYEKNYRHFISAAEMREELEKRITLNRAHAPFDSTSSRYQTTAGGKLGFIASESEPFCGQCSRLRLSAKGDLHSCLMSEAGENIRYLKSKDLSLALRRVMALKPTGRLHHVDRPMYQIGG